MFMVNEKNLSWVFLSQRRRVCVVQSLVDNVAKCEGYGVMCWKRSVMSHVIEVCLYIFVDYTKINISPVCFGVYLLDKSI